MSASLTPAEKKRLKDEAAEAQRIAGNKQLERVIAVHEEFQSVVKDRYPGSLGERMFAAGSKYVSDLRKCLT